MTDSRWEFVEMARADGANLARLCRRYGVSRKTGYKWLGRENMEDLSRRPRASPNRTPPEMEAAVLESAARHPAWGARKVRTHLASQGVLGLPSASTVVEIFKRNGVSRQAPVPAGPWTRFESPEPNQMWQMDFKGHFATAEARCHPLTLLDDCSRFSPCVRCCANETTETVRAVLESVFARNGLPWAILCDNGPPWGCDAQHRLTRLSVWLLRLGVEVWHGRPYHPQTQGKLERFHRTLKLEALQGKAFRNLRDCQLALDAFRHDYNWVRPHEAIDMRTPSQRYAPSVREMPQTLLEPEYAEGLDVRKVHEGGFVHYRGLTLDVPKALVGQRVGIKPLDESLLDVYFFTLNLATIDLRDYTNV